MTNLHKTNARGNRVTVARYLVVLLFAGALVTSMPQYKVSADPCRPKSTLGITSIISSVVVHAEPNPDGSGTNVFIVDFTVATQHAVLCGSTIPNCSNDLFIFRSDLSSNVLEAVPIDDGSCGFTWQVTPQNQSSNVTFGFKLNFEENYNNTFQLTPRKKLGSAGIVPAALSGGGTVDITSSMVEAPSYVE